MTHSFPTRRSSDLVGAGQQRAEGAREGGAGLGEPVAEGGPDHGEGLLVVVRLDGAGLDGVGALGPLSALTGGAVDADVARARVADLTPAGSVEDGRPLGAGARDLAAGAGGRSEEHTSELQSLMRISYAVFCLKKKNERRPHT